MIPPLVSSFPSTSYDAEPQRQTLSSQEKPDLAKEDCECSFCYELYRKDGKEWLECACCRWVHEHCLEDIIVDKGQELFCPFCINQFSVP